MLLSVLRELDSASEVYVIRMLRIKRSPWPSLEHFFFLKLILTMVEAMVSSKNIKVFFIYSFLNKLVKNIYYHIITKLCKIKCRPICFTHINVYFLLFLEITFLRYTLWNGSQQYFAWLHPKLFKSTNKQKISNR